MCDSSDTSIDYFSKHLALMKDLGESVSYKPVEDVKTFFEEIGE